MQEAIQERAGLSWFWLWGCTSSRGARGRCIIFHRSACSRGYKQGERGREAPKSLLEEEMIEASANIGTQESACVCSASYVCVNDGIV